MRTFERPISIQLDPIPETAVNIYKKKQTLFAKVIDKYRISEPSSPNFCWHVVLDISGSEMAKNYRIGQSIGVMPKGRFNDHDFNYVHESLTDQIRLYSISSACWGDDWQGQTVSLCVKRDLREDAKTGELVMGAASNMICDAKIGDEIEITGPVGKSFLLPDDLLDYNYVFVATGTGIAPFRGMLIELLNLEYDREVWLFFGAPYSTDLMYNDLFDEMAKKCPNFHYVPAVSREQKNRNGDKMYVQDQLANHEDQIIPLLNSKETKFYLCGLKGMEYGIYPWLIRSGSNLISLPENLSIGDVDDLARDSRQWRQIERLRDKDRFFKETY